MKTLITGTSRGIGFGLVSAALADGHTVYAVARNTDSLKKLKNEFGDRLIPLQLDISKPGGIEKLTREITAAGALDILVNNAGTMAKGESADDLAESFWVNSTVPFLLTKSLLPLLKKSSVPKVAQISTMMASIADNTSGGYYAYRSSKTALNMLTKSLAIDNPDVRFALIHPGWVKTEMGGANAPTDVSDSVRGIWKVISEMSA
ncbi:MAG: SDR family NAD(P)-dependent oxidoreductase, partial [Bdellovibrionales bacterium]|nr:SDR family NAD(P)-dependent oxidoreductase [Bdellovibrionales bacterium]